MNTSGRQKGDRNVEVLTAYLDRLKSAGGDLPSHGGKINVTAVALACGFKREVLYQNPRCQALLRDAQDQLGLSPEAAVHPHIADDRAKLERRINKLEQENASLYAEVLELRRKLKRFEHIETSMTETGRRVVP